ncbi:hypothetical protein PO250_01790 [Limosilactobacillus mucosae]|uniref:Ig-like domain-containing protein n=1 Tax=Limosilactobacillus mucosae TaxID=97478 RepID=A0AAJ1HT53_LIMMU|nr:hypothetical protein [Limosilactobacillus mucosae]MDC2829067.1 hypothetical protein [Limosilactobacillus mucosae]
MAKPTITMDLRDVYVQKTKIKNPYNILDLANGRAFAADGTDITDSLVISLKKVDFRNVGDYECTMSVMDIQGNLAINYLMVHVVPAHRLKNVFQSIFPFKKSER